MATKRLTFEFISKLLLIIALFIFLNFNQDLATIYGLMILASYMFWRFDRNVSLPVERKVDRAKTLAFAFGGYIVFFVSNSLINSFASSGGLATVFENLASTTPVLQQSLVLTYIGWGIFIPIVETLFFFGLLFEWILQLLNVNPLSSQIRMNTAIGIAMTSGLFALFHITSKNLENVPLMLTFIFGVISCYLVLKEKQLLAAIGLHIFTNSTAVLFTFRPEVFAAFAGGLA